MPKLLQTLHVIKQLTTDWFLASNWRSRLDHDNELNVVSKSFPRFIAILTVTTACSSLKHEPVADRPVSPQVQQIPVTDDDGRQVFSDDQDIVAQMQSRRATFQFSAGQHGYTETVDWETENKKPWC